MGTLAIDHATAVSAAPAHATTSGYQQNWRQQQQRWAYGAGPVHSASRQPSARWHPTGPETYQQGHQHQQHEATYARQTQGSSYCGRPPRTAGVAMSAQTVDPRLPPSGHSRNSSGGGRTGSGSIAAADAGALPSDGAKQHVASSAACDRAQPLSTQQPGAHLQTPRHLRGASTGASDAAACPGPKATRGTPPQAKQAAPQPLQWLLAATSGGQQRSCCFSAGAAPPLIVDSYGSSRTEATVRALGRAADSCSAAQAGAPVHTASCGRWPSSSSGGGSGNGGGPRQLASRGRSSAGAGTSDAVGAGGARSTISRAGWCGGGQPAHPLGGALTQEPPPPASASASASSEGEPPDSLHQGRPTAQGASLRGSCRGASTAPLAEPRHSSSSGRSGGGSGGGGARSRGGSGGSSGGGGSDGGGGGGGGGDVAGSVPGPLLADYFRPPTAAAPGACELPTGLSGVEPPRGYDGTSTSLHLQSNLIKAPSVHSSMDASVASEPANPTSPRQGGSAPASRVLPRAPPSVHRLPPPPVALVQTRSMGHEDGRLRSPATGESLLDHGWGREEVRRQIETLAAGSASLDSSEPLGPSLGPCDALEAPLQHLVWAATCEIDGRPATRNGGAR
jgi:hypothetical protein